MGVSRISIHPGDRFGRWTVISSAPSRDARYWYCRCDCGTNRIVGQQAMRMGKSKSCGCLRKEVASQCARLHKKHGESKRTVTKEYRAWAAMVNRCHNPKNAAYVNYGGRGISVCQQWRDSYEQFLKDVGRAPSSKHSIDRKQNNCGYEPNNVRWATSAEQSRNRRDNRLVSHAGRCMPVSAWAEELGVKYATLRRRLAFGWSAEAALTTHVKRTARWM